jgi:hypothetical protein
VEGDAGGDLVDHLLDDEDGFVVVGGEGVRWVYGEPGDARHDDAHAEDAADAVVVDDAGERHIVVDVLLAEPAFGRRGVLDGLIDDADRVVVPLGRQREVPLLEVGVDELGELQHGERLVLVGGVVGGFGEGVCARADVGQVDADQGEAVCRIFFRERRREPAGGAGEDVDWFGALDAGCDLMPG